MPIDIAGPESIGRRRRRPSSSGGCGGFPSLCRCGERQQTGTRYYLLGFRWHTAPEVCMQGTFHSCTNATPWNPHRLSERFHGRAAGRPPRPLDLEHGRPVAVDRSPGIAVETDVFAPRRALRSARKVPPRHAGAARTATAGAAPRLAPRGSAPRIRDAESAADAAWMLNPGAIR